MMLFNFKPAVTLFVGHNFKPAVTLFVKPTVTHFVGHDFKPTVTLFVASKNRQRVIDPNRATRPFEI